MAVFAACLIRMVVVLGKKKDKKRYHPVGGTIFHLMLNFNKLYHYLTDLTHKNTTFRILYLDNSEIYTSDPANVEYFLKTNFANYGKGSFHHDVLEGLLGDGIFTVDGEKWRQQRKMSSYEFSTRNLRDFSSGVFKTNAANLAHIVSSAANSNQIIEIQALFMKSALDTVFKVVLGVDLDSMRGTNEGSHFSEAFDKASEMTCYRYVDISWKIKKFLNIGSEATLKECIKIVDAFVYKVIESKMEQMSKPNQMNRSDILSRFLQMDQKDPKYLKDIILSFIIAGKDSTGSGLSWFFYLMCKHPTVQEKLVKEVKEAAKLDDSSSIDEIAMSLTEEALDRMHLLHAALSETLRLYPSIPADGKMCFADDTFPDGFSVKKGNLVSYVPYSMGRMKSLWGEDAEEFRPERWLDENGVFRHESSFKFTAFQAGPRICLGKEFAYRQMKVLAAVLLSAFSFKLADETKPVNYRTMLTLQIDGGLHLRATSRIINKSNEQISTVE
ncbi:cytochrome P450- family 704- subfamily A-polypeptide 2 [Striga hermonthica]|uniref:Cytochrome P450- family 704- subfamily A-polypeptide 2 n=1 Tax=Striga hermonthica TaxID=68872 RepID=A0A9N7MMN5_STRHE|nr:cytochrome P450- family 704- subfamily A-polypeptide 2 [Striga hermonthica]